MSEPTAKKSTALKTFALIAGLTTITLLIFCGGLFAIGASAFQDFVTHQKTTEAQLQLGQLEAGMKLHCTSQLPYVVAGPVPAKIPFPKTVPEFAEDAGFVAYGLTNADPVYYQYSVVANSDGSYSAIAEGDLDNNGIRSRFEIRCNTDCTCDNITIDRRTE